MLIARFLFSIGTLEIENIKDVLISTNLPRLGLCARSATFRASNIGIVV